MAIETYFRPKELKETLWDYWCLLFTESTFDWLFQLESGFLATLKSTEIGAFREIEVRGGTPFDFIIFLFLAIETDFRPIETLWDY